MKNKHMKYKNQKGFTLVELSIVLIIIGLIIGGVLAGQALITNARLTATLTQRSDFTTFFNIFADSTGGTGVPGDLIDATSRWNNVANGGGNSQIDSGAGTDFVTAMAPTETGSVVDHLAAAGIFGANYDETAQASNIIGSGVIAADLGDGFVIYSSAPNQHFMRFGIGNNPAADAFNFVTPFDPALVARLDGKIDDGVATGNGSVTSAGAGTLGTAGQTMAGATQCNDAMGIYTTANTGTCAFRMRLL